jgi:hypothetical protein
MPTVRAAGGLAAALAVALMALTVPAAQADDPSLELSAYGTPVVDGLQGAGEWDNASKWDFTVNVPGGTAQSTIYAMNDGVNLYLAFKHNRPDLDGFLNFAFDNDLDGTLNEEGDDVLIAGSYGFVDEFVSQQPPCPPGYTCIGIEDTEVGGTSDGSSAAGTTESAAFLELGHPLDTTDDNHDFSLRFGKRVTFRLSALMCDDECVSTSFVSDDVVIVSTSTIPPETTLTRGPKNGSFSRKEITELAFTATDDVIAPEDITFECNENGGAFDPCDNPYEHIPEREGRQVVGVRAVDEVGNVDPTPVIRRWVFDRHGPRKLSIRGPRRFSNEGVVLRLRATDNVDRPRHLRFRCALDGGRRKPCKARLVLRVTPGRHVLRFIAIDRTGNVSKRRTVKFVRETAS